MGTRFVYIMLAGLVGCDPSSRPAPRPGGAEPTATPDGGASGADTAATAGRPLEQVTPATHDIEVPPAP
jgi:hypothetical protein